MKELKTDAQFICENLGITEQNYCEIVEAGGLRWLKLKYPDESIRSAFSHSSMFWKWWVNQWEDRDSDFVNILKTAYKPLSAHHNRKIYFGLQNVEKLLCQPNSLVLKEVNNHIRSFQK